MKDIIIFSFIFIGTTLLVKNVILTTMPFSLIGVIGFYLISIMLNG